MHAGTVRWVRKISGCLRGQYATQQISRSWCTEHSRLASEDSKLATIWLGLEHSYQNTKSQTATVWLQTDETRQVTTVSRLPNLGARATKGPTIDPGHGRYKPLQQEHLQPCAQQDTKHGCEPPTGRKSDQIRSRADRSSNLPTTPHQIVASAAANGMSAGKRNAEAKQKKKKKRQYCVKRIPRLVTIATIPRPTRCTILMMLATDHLRLEPRHLCRA